MKCAKQETVDEGYELQLITGIDQENLTLCGLKLYKGSTLKLFLKEKLLCSIERMFEPIFVCSFDILA